MAHKIRELQKMQEIVVLGRGGQGGRTTARILGRAAFLNNRYVQDFALYGAERRGAPVKAFCRISDQPILKRGYITDPDYLIVLDDTLLHKDGLLGIKSRPIVLLNTKKGSVTALKARVKAVFTINATQIALDLLGRDLPSAIICGAFTELTDAFEFKHLELAIKIELARFPEEIINNNIRGARYAYEAETKSEKK